MIGRQVVRFGATLAVAALALPAFGQTDPPFGQAAGFSAGSPYSFRPLTPYWSYYAMPPAPPRYGRLNDTGVFMSSLNYPGIYGSYVFGATPTDYYNRSPVLT